MDRAPSASTDGTHTSYPRAARSARHTLVTALAAGLGLSLAGCFGSSSSGSSSLAGTYTGFMQEVGNGQVLHYSLAQTVTVTETNDIAVDQLTFTSTAFPSFQAIVLSVGVEAVSLQLVGVNAAGQIQLQEVGFAKDPNGNWVLVIQTAGGNAAATQGELVQYVSYDPENAPPATEVAAVAYLNDMFSLAALSPSH